MLMNNFEFYSPTDFVFGKNTEEQTGLLVKRFGGKRLLVVYGQGHAVKSGLMDRVEKALKEAELYYVLLGGIQPNPTDEEVYKGIDLGRQHNVDMILAVGGGSAIDAAKAMAAGTMEISGISMKVRALWSRLCRSVSCLRFPRQEVRDRETLLLRKLLPIKRSVYALREHCVRSFQS